MKDEQALNDIRDYLENTLRYSGNTVDQMMNSIQEMDDITFQWLTRWREEGIYPDERVEEVTVRELVNRLNMEPVNAFITISWLRRSPDEAKYALTHPGNSLELDEEQRQELLEEGEDDD